MSNSNDQVAEMYANPSVIQSRLLADLQARLTDGNVVVDGNNVCSFLMEGFASTTADLARSILSRMEALYPKRAQSAEDLHRHMSDFDYVGLYATPATAYVEILLRKDKLVSDAVVYNSNYNKVVIPKDTKIVIDQFDFSLYYPIEIRVNPVTDTFEVTHDTTEINPLFTLEQNTLEHRIRMISGLELLSILIPIYQFSVAETIDDAESSSAFIKSYDFTDQFYALRIFTNTGTNNTWVEMGQTLSDKVYDPTVLTASVTVDQELSSVSVVIPQIYVAAGLLGTRVRVEVLTTNGVVDADISNVQPEASSFELAVSGDSDIDKYIEPLTRPDVFSMTPNSTRVVGGTNGIDFDDLRQKVIHNTFHGTALLGPRDVTNYFQERGYDVATYQDGITDRIYLTHKELTDVNGVVVPAATVPTVFDQTALNGIATINDNTDLSYTILPTTIYKYNAESNTCTPLTDLEVAELAAMSVADLVNAYNDNIYTVSPYHIRLDSNDRYPMAYPYDLTKPMIDTIEFVQENMALITQMSVYNAQALHAQPGDGGFDIELEVVKSSDLADVDPADLKVVLVSTNSAAAVVYQECEFISAGDNNTDLYRAHLETNYDISEEHRIHIDSLANILGSTGHFIPLSGDMGLVFLVRTTTLAPTVDVSTITGASVAELWPDFTPVTEQSMLVTFGTLINEIHTRLDVLYTSQTYETYEANVYATYSNDEYERDETGIIVYTMPGAVMNKIHDIGDTIYREETVLLTSANIESYYGSKLMNYGEVILDAGNAASHVNNLRLLEVPVLLHTAGDVTLDANGNPIVSAAREVMYSVDLLQLDNKFNQSALTEHVTFMESMSELLRTHIAVVSDAIPDLREEMWLFFEPLRSLGTAEFTLSNNTTVTLELGISLKLRVYVYEHVIVDITKLDAVRDGIISIVDAHVTSGDVSTSIVADRILDELSDMVKFVDMLGINDQADLLTLIGADKDLQPHLKQELIVAADGTIATQRALDLEFVSVGVKS